MKKILMTSFISLLSLNSFANFECLNKDNSIKIIADVSTGTVDSFSESFGHWVPFNVQNAAGVEYDMTERFPFTVVTSFVDESKNTILKIKQTRSSMSAVYFGESFTCEKI